MTNTIIGLISKLKSEENPLIVSDELSYFLSDALQQVRINLYEAFVLNYEVIRFKRLGYIQPAWSESVHISNCIDLLNQKLLADVFNDDKASNSLKEWCLEAYKLNKEKRPHYIMDHYMDYINADQQPQLLRKLLEIRNNYNKLSFDDGPYHNESFPYDHYSPEEILLDKDVRASYNENKVIGGDVENLILELSLMS